MKTYNKDTRVQLDDGKWGVVYGPSDTPDHVLVSWDDNPKKLASYPNERLSAVELPLLTIEDVKQALELHALKWDVRLDPWGLGFRASLILGALHVTLHIRRERVFEILDRPRTHESFRDITILYGQTSDFINHLQLRELR